MSAHTSARWKLLGRNNMGHVLVGVEGMPVAVVGHGCNEDPEADANARLIAAAPDLLAACKQMVKSLNGSAGDFAGMLAAHRALDAAIAKAEGER